MTPHGDGIFSSIRLLCIELEEIIFFCRLYCKVVGVHNVRDWCSICIYLFHWYFKKILFYHFSLSISIDYCWFLHVYFSFSFILIFFFFFSLLVCTFYVQYEIFIESQVIFINCHLDITIIVFWLEKLLIGIFVL